VAFRAVVLSEVHACVVHERLRRLRARTRSTAMTSSPKPVKTSAVISTASVPLSGPSHRYSSKNRLKLQSVTTVAQTTPTGPCRWRITRSTSSEIAKTAPHSSAGRPGPEGACQIHRVVHAKPVRGRLPPPATISCGREVCRSPTPRREPARPGRRQRLLEALCIACGPTEIPQDRGRQSSE